MTWTNIKELLDSSLSVYSAKRTLLMRSGKYMTGNHWGDGVVSMLYETLQELSETDDFDPFTVEEVRSLIYAFNRLTAERVPDVWVIA